MDTLPHLEFVNEHNLKTPGRSYAHDGVKILTYRKLATLAGLHKEKIYRERAFETRRTQI